ncbi:MAG TPA: class I SAM-dependent methyltransferase [Acetobacteraceae bacterium]|nr:class I SAM-dependent methyltransferase [Acetobacteraceae bacterium]
MPTDAHAASAEFYATPRGAVAARLVRERLARLWPELKGQSVLGVGYAQPYLRLWRGHAARCIALTPPAVAATRWPMTGKGLTCVAEEHALPFPDLSFDRVLLVHGLEAAENRRVLLREVWRVLKDDGRLLVLVPNRTGLWAYAESTPFGHGQPFSVGQIGRLLADSLFRAERSDAALYMPPTGFMLRSAVYAERIGPRIAPGFGGVILVEALKDAYAALPLAGAPRRRLVVEEAAA